MAAPLKKGLEYFSHDVSMSVDEKIEYLESVHGIVGYAVYLKLLEKIFRNGYYLAWDKRTEAIFSKRSSVELPMVQGVVAGCIEEGLFDKKKFVDKGVLTSSGIQRRYLKATERRKTLTFRDDINCLEVNEYINLINVRNNLVNAGNTPVNEGDNPQSKVKESKVKESKGKEKKRVQGKERKGKARGKKKKKKGVYGDRGATEQERRKEEIAWNELLDLIGKENPRYQGLLEEGNRKGFKRTKKK